MRFEDRIAVVIPTHRQRMTTLLPYALSSVAHQEFPAAAISLAVDVDCEGAAVTRHRALMAVDPAATPWVAFLDSDDYFFPEHLQVLIEAASRTGASFVYSWFEVLGGTDPFPETHFSTPWDPANPRHTTVTTMVRTKLAQAVGYLNKDAPDSPVSGEDWLFTLGCIERGAKVHHVAQRTWAWRHHGMNTSGLPTRGDAI